jgi:hypothetical protein
VTDGRREEDICTNCGQEFGDHRAKPPHKLYVFVKNQLVKCYGFSGATKMKSNWFEEENMEIGRTDYLLPFIPSMNPGSPLSPLSPLGSGSPWSGLRRVKKLMRIREKKGKLVEWPQARRGYFCGTCNASITSNIHKTMCAAGESLPCLKCIACGDWTPGKERRCVNGFVFAKD